jgi:hypothetical protein
MTDYEKVELREKALVIALQSYAQAVSYLESRLILQRAREFEQFLLGEENDSRNQSEER